MWDMRSRMLVAALLVVLAVVALPAPAEAALRRCSVEGKERSLGATYVTSLLVQSMTCRRGQELVRAFHRCRRRNGGADGRCASFSGLRCREQRPRRAPTQYDARVQCRSGSRRVHHAYTQFT